MCVALSSRYVNRHTALTIGPCPPCYQVHRPPESCFCGKESRLVKCADFDPDSPGWSCNQPCATPLDCNVAEMAMSDGNIQHHTCEMLCHQGPCPPCLIKEMVSCFCGKHSKEIYCSEKEFPKPSHKKDCDKSKSWLGFYQCEEICARYYSLRVLF